jgi:hypothetical protein
MTGDCDGVLELVEIHLVPENPVFQTGNIITIGYQAMADSISLGVRGGV